MEKAPLLRQLGEVREQAESVHVEIVVAVGLIAELEKLGKAAGEVRAKLQSLKMLEQKCLHELAWILDQLDQFPR